MAEKINVIASWEKLFCPCCKKEKTLASFGFRSRSDSTNRVRSNRYCCLKCKSEIDAYNSKLMRACFKDFVNSDTFDQFFAIKKYYLAKKRSYK